MIIDHVGAVFFPYEPALRIIGRIAFPLYAWCMAVGAEYTHDIKKYALRLLLMGIISQPIFVKALHHPWHELNIFFTLFLGLTGIIGIRLQKSGSHIWCPMLVVLVSCVVYVDYFWQGVLFILLLYAVRKSRTAICTLMVAFCLYWGSSGASMITLLGIPLPVQAAWLPYASTLFSVLRRIQFWAILSLPLMLFPVRLQFKLPQWISYAAYPVHLLLIYLIHSFA